MDNIYHVQKVHKNKSFKLVYVVFEGESLEFHILAKKNITEDNFESIISSKIGIYEFYRVVSILNEDYKDKLKLIRSRRKKQAMIEAIQWAAQTGEGDHYTEVKKNGQIIGIY